MALVTLATCNLAQFALDFQNNLRNVITSIRAAKARGAKIRLGPELELCGYGCEDHFYEDDTVRHCWECIEELLKSDITNDIVCDVGMPVSHFGVRYNCRVIIMNRRILMIRPKMWLAEDGNYREGRWFSAWGKGFKIEDHILPPRVRELTGQSKVPFGIGALQFNDTMYANETCEELFTANNPGIQLGLAGVEIIGNGSGSHLALAKATRRFELIEEETKKNGGVYLYANQSGCDGGRLYFDGSAIVAVNGGVISHGTQFNIQDVEVVVATIDLRDVRSYRTAIMSRGRQAALSDPIPIIPVDESLTLDAGRHPHIHVTEPHKMEKLTVEQETAMGPACWMWDYLRRSGQQGFFLPLSGGSDSAAVAALVRVMCRLVYDDIVKKALASQPFEVNEVDVVLTSKTLEELRRVVRDPSFTPRSPKEICNKIFYTAYMGSRNSSDETKQRAAKLAEEVGANHVEMNIDNIVEAFTDTFSAVGPRPDLTARNTQQNVAAQNLQPRTRMVLSYLCAQMMLVRDRPGQEWPGNLLVLASANLDESNRGYYTKYGCSAADINPIGSLPKLLLRKFLVWAAEMDDLPTLKEIVSAPASAELQAKEGGKQQQTDEMEMGMTFEELDLFGRLRVSGRCGPVSMYQKVSRLWQDEMTPRQVAEKIKKFFRWHTANRHKASVLPPAVHLAAHCTDDNRYDCRQVIYNCAWPWQFARVDAMAEEDEAHWQAKVGAKRSSAHMDQQTFELLGVGLHSVRRPQQPSAEGGSPRYDAASPRREHQ